MFSSAPPPADVVDKWSHEPNLDFLRTIAVLCVVTRHVLGMFSVRQRWWLSLQALGIFGVLMFFVHTSLVLMMSLDRSSRTGDVPRSRVSIAFFVRRFFRIYPLSVAAVLVTYFTLSPHADSVAVRAGIVADGQVKDLWANLLLVQDIALRPSLLAPLWSLPAEVQMYLALPVLFAVVKRYGVRAIVGFVWPFSVALAILTWRLDLRFTVARYAPCFVAGIVCFGLLERRRPLPFGYLPLSLCVLLLGYMAAYSRFGLQAGLGMLVTATIAGLIPNIAPMNLRWLKTASQIVAKYSFGIYLCHVPCIWVAFDKLQGLGFAGSALCLVLLIFASAAASYHLIEAPFVRLGKRVADGIIREPRRHPATVPFGLG